MKENYAFGTFCAICSAISSFVFGALCLYSTFTTKDMMYIPFVVIGFIGSMVMYANRK